MMLLRQPKRDRAPWQTWQVFSSDADFCITERTVPRWRVWQLGTAAGLVLDEVASRLSMNEAPEDFLPRVREKYDGHYALLLLSTDRDRLVAVTDPYAIVKLYVARTSAGLALGTQLPQLVQQTTAEIVPESLAYFFVTGYTPSRHTLWRDVEKIPPGTIAIFSDGQSSFHDYLALLPPADPLPADDYLAWFARHWDVALEAWLNGFQQHVLYLSGGIDSTLLLDRFLHAGMPPDRCEAITIRYEAHAPCEDNEVDIQYSRRVAQHYGVQHRLVRYPAAGDQLLDDFRRMVAILGCESTYSLGMLKLGTAERDGDFALYSGQNADSVLSFGSQGHPSFVSRAPFVQGLGGWCARFYLFGGCHDHRFHPERPIVRALLRAYERRRSAADVAISKREVLLGVGMQPDNWPFVPSDPSFAPLANPRAVASWFSREYLSDLDAPFARDPHAVMQWLYVNTYMQGAANRSTALSGPAGGHAMYLPFANLGLLRQTARLRADSRFYWHGKYPNIYLANKIKGFPDFVRGRTDGEDSMPILMAAFIGNRRMNEYVHHLLDDFRPEQLEGVLKFQHTRREYWREQLLHHEQKNYVRMQVKTFASLLWFLALREQVASSTFRELRANV